MNAIERACVAAPGDETSTGPQRLAAALGVTPGLVSQWSSGRTRVSAERCIEIERITSGAVRCEDLRPDIDWAVVRGVACQPPAPISSRGDTAPTQQEAA